MSDIMRASQLRTEVHHLRKFGQENKAYTTGFTALDDGELQFRLAKGRFMIVTGIPGMGKSEIMDAMVMNMAVLHGWKTLFFSPENNPADEHLAALVEKYVGKKIRNCTLPEVDKAMDFIDSNIFWTCPKNKSIDNLLAIAKRTKDKDGLDMMIIDPWNYVEQNRHGEMVHEHLSNSLNKITTFSREENVLMVVVAHPINMPKDKNGNTQVPDLYSISDGAQWRNKADYGVVVHRGDMSKNRIQFYVGKRKKKWMGNIGMVELDYDVESGRFKAEWEKEFLLPDQPQAPF